MLSLAEKGASDPGVEVPSPGISILGTPLEAPAEPAVAEGIVGELSRTGIPIVLVKEDKRTVERQRSIGSTSV